MNLQEVVKQAELVNSLGEYIQKHLYTDTTNTLISLWMLENGITFVKTK